MPEEAIIIIGAGHAGVQTAVRLRELEWAGRIVIVAPDADEPYERPPLSKDFLKASEDEVVPLRRPGYYESKGIERISALVTEIRTREAQVVLADGRTLAYHKLVLAPGSQARKLTVPGAELPGVHLLKTREDARALKKALIQGARVVVIGAGYIGLEVAAAAAALGCETTVLEFQDRVMSRVTSEPVSHFFEQLHSNHGTALVFGAAVTELRGKGRVEEVRTADGSVYPANIVVAGVGVVPLQELASGAGLDTADGIIVDGDSRTSDPHIYAAGDATRYIDAADGINRRLESIQSAVAQGISAANHIMGVPPGKREVPWFWTVQHGVRLQTAGLRHPDDTVIVRGLDGVAPFSVLYLRDGRLASIDTVGSLKDFTPGKKLIAAGALLDPVLAADPTTKLTDAVRDLVTYEA
ncbi:NAD(P)/FAD-dependent oxidoreductase [Pseudarthrobacter sp. B4EP4b]|uniref:NAD(P)/FAD-dependent oxidoreductase n=1 Tax=Pseudarthrobacter sp. B4EP4b TaxID=2590664 RepID=UPI00114FDA02|nr:FAD-dependent oxidoreductase [Pseudarthrobacter sp. B4EP4b]